jgi:glutathione S-transferase
MSSNENDADYTIVYWAGISGRALPLILMLEDAQLNYMIKNDVDAFIEAHNASDGAVPVFACPILRTSDEQVWSQTTAIAVQLGAKLGFEGGASALQQALNLIDVWSEAYRARKSPDKGDAFLKERAGRWLDVLEKSVAATSSGADYVFGERVSYVDFVLVTIVEFLLFVFGERADELVATRKRIVSIVGNVKSRPNIKAWFQSNRHLPIIYAEMAATSKLS